METKQIHFEIKSHKVSPVQLTSEPITVWIQKSYIYFIVMYICLSDDALFWSESNDTFHQSWCK